MGSVPESLASLLTGLERLASYDGPWTRLRAEQPALRLRIEELRQRVARMDDLLLIALVGGSGVGKSTLLNALAGAEIARTSEYRPCTTRPAVYAPESARALVPDWDHAAVSPLRHLVIVDTPDSDTIIREHRERVVEVLRQCDLILVCGSAEKYLDEATWSLLRPLRAERSLVAVETKAGKDDTIRAHWLARAAEQGIRFDAYFRVDALRSLHRKTSGTAPPADELDFPRLESFLRDELNSERIRRIKQANAAGLLENTLQPLVSLARQNESVLDALRNALNEADARIARDGLETVASRLFTEPHLWTLTLHREVSLRARGLFGSILKLAAAARLLPARMRGGWWRPWPRNQSSEGESLALFNDQLDAAVEAIAARCRAEHSEANIALLRAGFEFRDVADAAPAIAVQARAQAEDVLRGPAREALDRHARRLTSLPVSVAADTPPVLLLGYAAYDLVTTYFSLLPTLGIGFLMQTLLLLAMLLGGEVYLFGIFAARAASNARKNTLQVLHQRMLSLPSAFTAERAALDEARELCTLIHRLRAALD